MHVYSSIIVSQIFILVKVISGYLQSSETFYFYICGKLGEGRIGAFKTLCPVWFGSCKCRCLCGRDVADVRQEVLGLGEKSA